MNQEQYEALQAFNQDPDAEFYFMYKLFEQLPTPHGVMRVNKKFPVLKNLWALFAKEADALGYIQAANLHGTGLLDELVRLNRWKAEAIEVFEEWDKVYEIVNAEDPSPIGKSKAKHCAEYIDHMIKAFHNYELE